MDLFKFLKELKKYKKALIVSGIIGGLTGVVIYFLPQRYSVEGSFFIGRESETSNQFFTYEGYYSQSNAALFTDTVIALIESPDMKKALLDELKLPVTSENLRKIDKYISVKRPGAHLATLTVRSYNKDEATYLWNTFSDIIQTKVNRLTARSDAEINITPVNAEPLVEYEQHILLVNIVLGVLGGIVLYGVWIFIKLYLKLK